MHRGEDYLTHIITELIVSEIISYGQPEYMGLFFSLSSLHIYILMMVGIFVSNGTY